MSAENQRKHDLLMEMRPDDATHDKAMCMYCTAKAFEEENVAEDQKIFTQEQHEQLLTSAVERASAEARAEADAEVLSLNEKLEAATEAADETARTIADLQKQIEDRDEAVRLATLEGERVADVQAVVAFSDEQIEKRKESWSKMDEEAFEAYLEDIKEAATASASDDDDDDDDDGPDTSFDQTRTTADDKSKDKGSALTGFFNSDLDLAAQS
jgi:hypothetical protein